MANEIETISVVTFSTWIRSIKSNDVYKVMLQIGVKCVQQIKMMIMKFTKRSYCELLKKALVWEYRISIVTSVWRAFCHISAYFCNWLRCEISYYRYLRWIYLQYPKKTGNGREKKVTKVQIDITISCNCGPKVISRAYPLAVINDITLHWDIKTVYTLMIFR